MLTRELVGRGWLLWAVILPLAAGAVGAYFGKLSFDSSVADLIAQANQDFNDANTALQKNPPDYATYGAKLQEAQQKIKQANDLLASQGAAGSTSTTTTTTTTAPSA